MGPPADRSQASARCAHEGAIGATLVALSESGLTNDADEAASAPGRRCQGEVAGPARIWWAVGLAGPLVSRPAKCDRHIRCLSLRIRLIGAIRNQRPVGNELPKSVDSRHVVASRQRDDKFAMQKRERIYGKYCPCVRASRIYARQ